MIRTLFVVLLVSLVSFFGLTNIWQQYSQSRLPLTEAYIEIKAGDSAMKLCRNWQQQNLLSNAQCRWLSIYLRIHPELSKLHQGVYRVPTDQKPTRLLQMLHLFASGKVAQFAFSIKEGETLSQSLKRLAEAEYLQHDLTDKAALVELANWPEAWGNKPANAEALFFAETYNYTAHSTSTELLKRANELLIQRLQQAWDSRQANLPYKTPYELLTMASIVEKESGHEPEKPLVSSVFVNRLALGMKLQTDPTVIYGLGDSFNGDITRADLRNPHLYNTYQHFGLPPGPIAAPSGSSIIAAAQPAQSDWLYFVSKGDGTHQFSRTLKEHNAAVQHYILGKRVFGKKVLEKKKQ
ncbi:MAG: aminodeoxychorismate lyase [Chromatiales bacterium RIFOXYA1_FULL_46_5]|nr:MAG: aminodeoxychorismate lyase [Chromatiales bacterium RIFOXYA1_FULL_46_5]